MTKKARHQSSKSPVLEALETQQSPPFMGGFFLVQAARVIRGSLPRQGGVWPGFDFVALPTHSFIPSFPMLAFRMFWKRLLIRGFLTASEKATQEHSAWLTAALRSKQELPRIPVRRADTGGFDALRNRPSGKDHAERWWALALERVPE
jgi:hypothetical protein